jgi:hypothetical protein
MNVKLVLLLMLAILAGGCIEKLQGLQADVPVLHAKVTMGEEFNGTMVIQGIEAYAEDIPRNKAPMYNQFPEKFPAVYIDIVQNMSKLNYQVGKNYNGPGVYDFSIGLKGNLTRSKPVAILISTVDKNSESGVYQTFIFNWSTQIQNKTFK